MKPIRQIITPLALVLGILCGMNVQAGNPGLLENYTSENVVLNHDAYAIDDGPVIREVDPFTYGLVTAMNIYGFAIGLNMFTGVNRFDGSDNVKKDADIGMNTSLYYERMLCHTMALGAFLLYETALQVNREGPGRFAQHLFLAGVVATAYWGFGKLNRGGILAAMTLAAGFSVVRSKFDDETIKGPKSPLIRTGLSVGGWVMATKCLMFFATVGLLTYQVEWLNTDEFESTPDMTVHSLDFGLSSWSPTIGFRFLCGGRDRPDIR